MTRRRWLAVGVVAVWSVILAGLAVWSMNTGPETVRAHSDLVTGRQALDRAVEVLRAGAGPDTAVEVGPYQVSTGCRLTLARRGTEVRQVVALTVPPGTEAAVLERLARAAPAEWDADAYPDTRRFRADAGDFVTVVGEPVEPGQLRLTVATGCRPGTDPALPDQ